MNTLLFKKPEIVEWAVKKYGSQAIVASIDIKDNGNGESTLYSENGKFNTNINLKEGLDLVRNLKWEKY